MIGEKKGTGAVIISWIALNAVIVALYLPCIYDIVLFILYAINDFGSAMETYVDVHLNGWSYWAIA